MKTFFDLMREAQQNAMASPLAKEFGLSAEEQARAFAALAPAFWLGLRNSTADPFGVAAFWQQFAAGQYKPYFDNPFAAMTPKGQADGNRVLETLFGSPQIARAVALQVEAATGIAQDVVKRMMPVMANMMMGGLQRQAEEFENPFLRFFRDMTEGKKDRKAAEMPFAALMESFLGKEPEPEPGPMSQEEVIDRLFDAGRSLQASYWKSMQSLFDGVAPKGEGGTKEKGPP
jgi:hypothetical protein